MRKFSIPLLVLCMAVSVGLSASGADFPRQYDGVTFESLDPAFEEIVSSASKVEILADGFRWSEGPVWIAEENCVVFSDVPENIAYKWKAGEGLSVYLKPSGLTDGSGRGGSNGLVISPDNKLVLCQHGDRRVAWMDAPFDDPAEKYVTIVDSYNGKKFNSPNDAVYHKNGDLYFTDPPYGISQDKTELDFNGVYRYTADGALHLVTKDLSRPNGIALSPDYQTLYVANSDRSDPKWVAFDVNEKGETSNMRLFFDAKTLPDDREGGCDGLKVDQQGNVFATGPGGVLVFNPEGKHLGTILVDKRVANCGFGNDGHTLYLTATDTLLRLPVKTKGMGF